jgi:hypothetical protein
VCSFSLVVLLSLFIEKSKKWGHCESPQKLAFKFSAAHWSHCPKSYLTIAYRRKYSLFELVWIKFIVGPTWSIVFWKVQLRCQKSMVRTRKGFVGSTFTKCWNSDVTCGNKCPRTSSEEQSSSAGKVANAKFLANEFFAWRKFANFILKISQHDTNGY